MMRFVHPVSKEPLVADSQGNLCSSSDSRAILFRPVDGCYDFARLQTQHGDRIYYDEHYYDGVNVPHDPLSEESLAGLWRENSAYEMLHEAVGDVQGKDMLLLGNGVSLKELAFAADGANLVFTDLSISAVHAARDAHRNLATRRADCGRVQFHAVDALCLPYEDEAFDVIYGCAFVHHLQDLRTFFGEVYRCLKPGGRCVFLDDAYSPWWQFAKRTVLRPLQAFSHWRNGISPEDVLATRKGGFTKRELERVLVEHGFSQLVFRRSSFLEHLVRRGCHKLGGRPMAKAIVPLARLVDRRLLFAVGLIEKHGLLLVWGYTK